jgi:hypothetical protein
MLEVISMTRAGRPRAATIATGVLLLVVTVAAGVLSHYKASRAKIALGEARLYSSLGVRARLPQGWEVREPERFDSGRILVAAGASHDSGRQIALFRARPNARSSRAVAWAAAGFVAPELSAASLERKGFGTLGSVESEVFVWVASGEEQRAKPILAEVVVSRGADRQYVGLAFVVAGKISPRDQRLFDEVRRSVSIEEVEAAPAATPREYDDTVEPADPDEEDEPEDTDDRPLVSHGISGHSC